MREGHFVQTSPITGASKEGELQNEASILRPPRHSRQASRESADLQRLTDATASQTSSPQGVSKGALPKLHSGVPRHHRSSSSGHEHGAGERFVMGSPSNTHLKDPSPSHSKAYQARAANKLGSASPALENKRSSDCSDTSSRSRPHGGNTLSRDGRSAGLPKFGSWDGKDPSSDFTVIFQKARDEKKSGASAAISQMQNEVLGRDADLYPKQHHPSRQKSSTRGFFSCFGTKAADA